MIVTSPTKTIVDASEVFKILSDPTRFEIIKLLISSPNELCVKEIAETIAMSHSATSHQLNRLEDKGVVCSERTGQTMCYTLRTSPRTSLLKRIINQCNQ